MVHFDKTWQYHMKLHDLKVPEDATIVKLKLWVQGTLISL